MGYNNDKIGFKGLTEENAQALKESHEGYENPVYHGTVEIVEETDDTWSAIYDREDVDSFQQLSEDAALFGGHPDTLYQ